MPRHPRLVPVCLVALAGLASCGGGKASSDTTGAVEVVSANDACTPARTSFAAGKVKFAIRNNGSAATELYVYEGDKVLTEVENVGPGTSRSLTADFKVGKSYQLWCKPGGKDIKVPITVTG